MTFSLIGIQSFCKEKDKRQTTQIYLLPATIRLCRRFIFAKIIICQGFIRVLFRQGMFSFVYAPLSDFTHVDIIHVGQFRLCGEIITFVRHGISDIERPEFSPARGGGEL